MKNEFGLTQQQEKFAQGVASGLSQADAYRAAHPKAAGWKDETVWKRASEAMKNREVLGRVKALSSAAADLVVLDRAEYLREMKRIAHSDIAGLFHPDGKYKLPHELDEDTRRAVKGFKIDEYGRIEYILWDKPSMLVNVAKIDGAFEKDNDQKKPAVTIGRIELVALSKKPNDADDGKD